MFGRARFTRERGGRFRVKLDPQERALLANLPDQLEELLVGGGAGDALVRLFPPAYTDDATLQAEYHGLMHDDLVRRRVEAVGVLRSTVTSDSLTEEELHTWLRVLNDVRLILGTVLDVSEDSDVLDVAPDSDDAAQRVTYVILSSIVDDAVRALTGALPPPTA